VLDDDTSPALLVLRTALAAARDWADPENQAARAAALRRVIHDEFDRQVDPDGTLRPDERGRRAYNARCAHFALLTYRSSRARTR
jgi:hypothetical protein